MIDGKQIVVVMPAYNAALTLEKTYREVMAQGVVDHVVVVDDCSRDGTADLARKLAGTTVIEHKKNLGYGGNQKTCYRAAMDAGADVVIMVHPDYQYTPLLIPAMGSLISSGLYHCVLGSRILGGMALRGGMPGYKYFSNRLLTSFQNLLTGAKLSEYHTGYRAFSRALLEAVPWDRNSDDFVFDNQMLTQIIWAGCTIAEITCPTKYFDEASSINFTRSCKYGIGCVLNSMIYVLSKAGLMHKDWLPGELRGKLGAPDGPAA
ncbi:MAG: glycosyltransferase family 2 protein [Kiritimatiellia bacterium]